MIHLLVNATVLTLDDSLPVAQALAVKDGRIVEVGGTDEILWLREDEYELIDLDGRTVVPGFVDPHNHFSIAALEVFWPDCRTADSVEELQRLLARAAAETPAGEWVRGVGYDHTRLAGRRHPTRADLDAAVADRPVLLMHYSHHQAVANSRALAAAGITRATPDPPGGEIGRDRAGAPSGLLFERAIGAVETASRAGWESRFVEVARAASLRYAALGITTIQDAAVTPAMARRYAEARAAGALAIDVGEVRVGSAGWFDPPDDAAPGAPVKLFADGGYRCAMRVGDRVSGFLFYERDALAARMLAAWRSGRNVVCHALGNLGVETAVGAIEDAVAREPAGRGRVRVDHAMFLDRALLARLVDLGVWVVVQPSFIWDHGGRSPSPDLLLRPFATAHAAGLRQAFSSDYPCGENAPLVGIQAAVTRRTRLGEPSGPEEAIPGEAALRAYTLDAARAAGFDADRGSLAPGKRADFLVLSDDPLQCPSEAIKDVQVLQTWVAGVPILVRP
ncbi:MAG TPA: amidohydrolase family protein [Candidatus Acidoferrum sp.]|nr:amidohydrolase family protein [Candidatus Acidoferrum sp.]